MTGDERLAKVAEVLAEVLRGQIALLASDALAQMLAEARAEAIASMVPPGPCWHDSGITWPNGVSPRCELRAGHAGAHECDRGAIGGTAVWTDRVDAEPDAGERGAGT